MEKATAILYYARCTIIDSKSRNVVMYINICTLVGRFLHGNGLFHPEANDLKETAIAFDALLGVLRLDQRFTGRQ